ncbi:MAG: AmmeMemoRadiSam system protein A [Campylobacterota bacterium]|nr:AmmeMemoRadiSam system protein A [Campylobacterota bacterium]
MGEIVIGLAKAAIAVALGMDSSFDLEEALERYPQLKENGAVFVTLTKSPNDQLRGCIGSLTAYQPLYKDIISNAESAALRDPRFRPLSKDELGEIKIEVSILSEPKPLLYRDTEDLRRKIKPAIDGVVLEYGGYRATYLPQVWEQLPQFDSFFASLCQKAGLAGECLDKHPDIKTYQATKYREES